MCSRAFVIAIRRNAKPGRSFVGRPFFLTPDYKTTPDTSKKTCNPLPVNPFYEGWRLASPPKVWGGDMIEFPPHAFNFYGNQPIHYVVGLAGEIT